MDPDTGQQTYIGSTGHHQFFWSAFAQDSQGKLFAATGNDLVGFSIYEIDPLSGLGTFVVQTNLHGIGCMAFGPGDVLYVGNDRYFPLNGSPYDLHVLDLATGQDTLIGDTGVTNMLAMDFHDGVLYGYPYDDGLSTIDLTTGLATDVNPNYRGHNGVTVSMCFDDEGTLYYIDQVLWMMDAELGTQAFVDYVQPFGFWAEAVFVEGPSSKFSLWLSGKTDGPVEIKVAGANPSSQVAIAWAKGDGGPTPIPAGFPCSGVLMDLNTNMRLAGFLTTDQDGKGALGPQIVPSAAVGLIHLQAIDLADCSLTNTVMVSF